MNSFAADWIEFSELMIISMVQRYENGKKMSKGLGFFCIFAAVMQIVVSRGAQRSASVVVKREVRVSRTQSRCCDSPLGC